MDGQLVAAQTAACWGLIGYADHLAIAGAGTGADLSAVPAGGAGAGLGAGLGAGDDTALSALGTPPSLPGCEPCRKRG